jgi:beta-galactosidase
MISKKLPQIWYGADYNPDQWPEEVWAEDMRMMQLAHVNVATLPVFSWALLQPAEDRYEFAWLDRILDQLADSGVYACLATSTAAQPAWMSQRFPDVLPTGPDGLRRRHGGRVTFCPSSPNYRRYSSALAEQLALRYKDHPTLVAWHIANEYGRHCYCDLCAEGFREWLKERHGSLEAVNEAWNTNFWSHRFYAWSEIEPPMEIGERGNIPMLLDYDRFQNQAILECYLGEYHAIKAITPEVAITTNFMSQFKPLNYAAWAPYLDVISFDSYPRPDLPMSDVAFNHEQMRGLKDGQPFMLMEQTPSQTNWMPRNPLKRPGVMRLQSYQAVAHGADTVMFFQWRRARGGPEKMHGAIVDHVGHEHTRVFGEVQTLGVELDSLGDALLDSRQDARVALLFDWENWWAIDYSSGPSVDLNYIRTCKRYYHALWQANIAVDVVRPEADLSGYDLVLAPMLYMVRPGVADHLEAYVRQGGTLLVSFLSGLVDENDMATMDGYPGELRNLLGIWVEEFDPLLEGETRGVDMGEPWGRLQGEYRGGVLCDLLHLEGAQARATFSEDFYAGRPALTVNEYGQGKALYLAADVEDAMLADLLLTLCDERGIAPALDVPAGVEVTQRVKEGQAYTFVLNHAAEEQSLHLPEGCRDLLSGQALEGAVTIAAHDVWILEGTPA